MDVHVRDLRYFVAVAEELSFTRAAERLFVSQPALSKQLRQLEGALGFRLLRRDHRSVELTAAGAALLPPARALVEDWEQARRAAAAAAASEAATLRVGLSTSVGRGLLPRVTERFAMGHPAWKLALRQVPWSDPTAGLADGSSDVALVWLPVPNPDAFGWVVIATEPRWVALPQTHPLVGRDEVDFAELLDEPFLALPASAGPLRDYWLALDHRGDRPARIAAEVRNADETFEAIANGIGLALLAAGNAAIYQRPGIAVRPVRGLSPSHLAVVWRADDDRVVVRHFAEACCVDSLPSPLPAD
jgi:DNA-binding transcriptional LysR family regulator